MTVEVAEENLRHRALISGVVCCEAGHPDPVEAVAHAWRLARAMQQRPGRGEPAHGDCREAAVIV